MKLFGLYAHQDIPNIEENHRKFAEVHLMDYHKISIKNYYEKWTWVYHILESHLGQTLYFIDAFSYFASAKLPQDIPSPIYIQEVGGKVMDNFFVVRCTHQILRIFFKICQEAQGAFVRNQLSFNPSFPSENIQPYGFKTPQGDLLNLEIKCLHNGRFLSTQEMPRGFDGSLDSEVFSSEQTKIFVATHGCSDFTSHFVSVANILCSHRLELPNYSENPIFEVVNPNQKQALLTLSSLEARGFGSAASNLEAPVYALVSENNFRLYAEMNNITLYIYRGIPQSYKGLHSTWTKPYLVLRHLFNHDSLTWIDADILISPDYELPTGENVAVFNDPGAWLFNAGFMTFKNSPVTIAYLHAVIARCESIGDRSQLYINGSDQTQFIEEYKTHFPDSLPRSNLKANTPFFHFFQKSGSGLWHFMGINPPSVRAILMDFCCSQLQSPSS